jgi:hypothetical protein
VIALEADQAVAVGQHRHALGVGVRLALQGLAVQALQRLQLAVGEAYQAARGVQLELGLEQVAVVGDGHQLAAGPDGEVRQAVQARGVGAADDQAAGIGEALHDRLGRVGGVQRHGRGR